MPKGKKIAKNKKKNPSKQSKKDRMPGQSQTDNMNRSVRGERDPTSQELKLPFMKGVKSGAIIPELREVIKRQLLDARDKADEMEIDEITSLIKEQKDSLILLTPLAEIDTEAKGMIKALQKSIKKLNGKKKDVETGRTAIPFARGDIEVQGSDANSQCIQALGALPLQCDMSRPSSCTKCYICGFPIDFNAAPRKPEQPASYQCEHVLVVMEIALLCGLAADRAGESACTREPSPLTTREKQFCAYNVCIDTLFDEYLDIDKDIKDMYLEYRRKLLKGTNNTILPAQDPPIMNGSVYQWSHSGCNEIKKNYSFIGITFEPSKIVVTDVLDDTIKWLLKRLTNRVEHKLDGMASPPKPKPGWFREFHWSEYFGRYTIHPEVEPMPELAKYFGEEYEIEETINNRTEHIKKYILNPIIETLREYKDQLLLFHAFSVLTLFIVIKKVFRSKNTPISIMGFNDSKLKDSLCFGRMLRNAYSVCMGSGECKKEWTPHEIVARISTWNVIDIVQRFKRNLVRRVRPEQVPTIPRSTVFTPPDEDDVVTDKMPGIESTTSGGGPTGEEEEAIEALLKLSLSSPEREALDALLELQESNIDLNVLAEKRREMTNEFQSMYKLLLLPSRSLYYF